MMDDEVARQNDVTTTIRRPVPFHMDWLRIAHPGTVRRVVA